MNYLKKALKYITLPRTKIIYEGLGVPEPEAWKHIVFSSFVLGLLLVSLSFFNIELILSIKDYSNVLNVLIGFGLLVGSVSVMIAWWGTKGGQSDRVLKEIRGYFFIFASFISLSLSALLFLPETTFTFVLSFGIAAGCLNRAIKLIRNHYKFLKAEL